MIGNNMYIEFYGIIIILAAWIGFLSDPSDLSDRSDAKHA